MEPHPFEADASSSSFPLRPRRHHSPICFASCFGSSAADVSVGSPDSAAPGTPRSRPKLRDLRGRCLNLAGRRRHHSADFRYDPLSYALNFDDGGDPRFSGEELPFRDFSSRLPADPPMKISGAKGIGLAKDASL